MNKQIIAELMRPYKDKPPFVSEFVRQCEKCGKKCKPGDFICLACRIGPCPDCGKVPRKRKLICCEAKAIRLIYGK